MLGVVITIIGVYSLVDFLASLMTPPKAITGFISLLAYVQLILAPWLFYNHFQNSGLASLWDLNMQVDSNTYFSFVLPGYVVFVVGMKRGIQKAVLFKDVFQSGEIIRTTRLMLLIGLLAHIIINFGAAPAGIEFTITIASRMFPAALITMHVRSMRARKSKNRFLGLFSPYSALLLAYLLLDATASGMFGDFIFMLFMLLVFSFEVSQPTWKQRTAFVTLGVLLLASVQLTKLSYRQLMWRGGIDSSITLFISNLSESFNGLKTTLKDEGVQFGLLVRANQGYLVSHVISRCQNENILLYGQKSAESLAASIVPRFAWPEKPKAGGRDNIERFTYKTLVGSTSMNISFFGDLFIDFGKNGGVFALFIYGMLLAKALTFLFQLASDRPVFLIGLPIVLSGMIQVETDMLMILNHTVKCSLFLYIIEKALVFRKKDRNWRLEQSQVLTIKDN